MPEFPIHSVLSRCAAAVADKPPAAMFGLRDEGYDSLYEQLVSSLLSVRTYDEVSTEVSRRLFALARTPAAMIALDRETILEAIAEATFAPAKADNILALSRTIVEAYAGETPADYDKLIAFRGVGPKVASLALGVALNHPVIAVDIHVHRITNRWGYVATSTPDKTRDALAAKLPRDLWIEINRVLVPFGKHVCTGTRPRCSNCPVFDDCARVGVR
ncbi:endonuclease-3 [Lewinella marina]|uniref:DNA lyase n=1 Tax=Neolewinella marina TaxID=438751 RepID=A0A2G0CE86_9BACT|nr:endonuclease III [Neolewinella marina]NJB87407.1 endonuclease-3 [Neolewinella marina]PHK98282.1 DNA lyase [Neolewinella marina]